MKRRTAFGWALAAVAAGMVGCGGSTADSGGEQGGETPDASAIIEAGPEAEPEAGPDAAPEAESDANTCGGQTCQDFAIANISFAACCTTAQECGLESPQTQKCLPKNVPGHDDGQCPNQALSFQGFSIPLTGCCRPDNTCGIETKLSALGQTFDLQLGCANAEDVGLPGLDGGAPASCDYAHPADGGPGDGGVATITCGSATCSGQNLGPLTAAPCCATEETGDPCGISVLNGACIQKNQPGVPGGGCKDVAVNAPGLGQIQLTGCCRADNTCGIEGTIAGFDLGVGCASGSAIPLVQLPPDSGIGDPCVYPTDAGTD